MKVGNATKYTTFHDRKRYMSRKKLEYARRVHPRRHPHRIAGIYHSWLHVFSTLLALVIPFCIFLGFLWWKHVSTSSFLYDLSLSTLRLVLAYIIAAVLAWLMAVSFYRGRFAVVALPFFDVLQSFPTFAALPLATYVWGKSTTTVVFFLVITIIWPIFFTLISSLKLARHDWFEAVDIAEIRGPAYLRWYLFPITVPGLITGSIIGIGEGWEALVATEMIVGTPRGLGIFFQSFSENTAVTTLGIFGLLIVIFAINKMLWLPLLEWSHHRMDE